MVAPRALGYSTCLTLLLPHRLVCAGMGATSAGSCWRRCSWPSGEPFLCLCRFGCGCGLPQRERERARERSGTALFSYFVECVSWAFCGPIYLIGPVHLSSLMVYLSCNNYLLIIPLHMYKMLIICRNSLIYCHLGASFIGIYLSFMINFTINDRHIIINNTITRPYPTG